MYDENRTRWLGQFAARPRRNKIAVLGFTSHMRQCPFHDDEWEIWGINDLYHELGAIFNRKESNHYERVRWFQLHSWVELHDHRPIEGGEFMNPQQGPPHPRDPNHLIWLKEASEHFPVYLIEPRAEMPNCLTLPKDDIFSFFRDGLGRPIKYYTNTISWELAYAIMLLVEPVTLPDGRVLPVAIPDATLGVWGVDMMMAGPTQGAEYSYQRPSCEWLLGVAMGLGIKVIVPSESDLLKSIYQYGDTELFYARKRFAAYQQDIKQQGAQSEQTMNQAREHFIRMQGADQALEWIQRAHLPGDDGPDIGQRPVPEGNKVPA